MAKSLDLQRLSSVFESRPDIISGIQTAADSPARIALFNDITSYVQDRLQANGEPALKRRKVENGAVNGVSAPAVKTNAADEEVLLEVKEISVAVPQRKKFELCFTANYLYARAPGTTAPIPAITHLWSDIEYAFYLPIPDKAQVQHNYVLFPRGTCLPSKTNPPTVEPLVFTVPATPPKQGTIGGAEASSANAVSDTYKSLFHWALDRRFKSVGNPVTIVSANPNKFHSMIRQPHRPNEKAVHVTGFRGSKDGFLFFLENGILWGFKKPLMFMPLERIVAISYTNILQITFNIVVEVMSGEGEQNEELEFGMLDQQDYGGIDDYIKTNRLQDRSMAEQRKAKLQLAENRKKGADGESAEGADGDAGQGGTTELGLAQLQAEQLLQDEEDEDEEDYDPGSDADSDGSGESSDEDDDDDDDDEDDEEEDDEEAGEEDAEGEEGGEAEPEEEEEEAPEEEAAPPPAPAPAPAPAKRGWAAFTSRPSRNANANADAMDTDEKFDVV